MTDSSETEGSERVDTETKRRKVGKVGSSVVRSASLLAQTLLACEERKEKRHQDVLELEERRLQMAENRNEMNRQGIDGLVTAVNNLSSAIHALVSNRHNTRWNYLSRHFLSCFEPDINLSDRISCKCRCLWLLLLLLLLYYYKMSSSFSLSFFFTSSFLLISSWIEILVK